MSFLVTVNDCLPTFQGHAIIQCWLSQKQWCNIYYRPLTESDMWPCSCKVTDVLVSNTVYIHCCCVFWTQKWLLIIKADLCFVFLTSHICLFEWICLTVCCFVYYIITHCLFVAVFKVSCFWLSIWQVYVLSSGDFHNRSAVKELYFVWLLLLTVCIFIHFIGCDILCLIQVYAQLFVKPA